MERRVVPVLRGLVISLAVAFAVSRVGGLRDVTPVWVTAVLTNGVYLIATSMVLVRAWRSPKGSRLPWLLLGTGLCTYTVGTAYSWIYTWNGAILPFPSISDAAWLLFYPQAYAGTLMFTRQHVGEGRRTLLDGAIAGLGGAALFSAGVVDFLVGTTGSGDFAQYVALCYPMGDSLLFGTILARVAVGRWIGLRSAMILGGFGTFILADTGYVTLGANGEYQPGGLIDVLYLTGLTLIGLSAWYDERPGGTPTERNRLGWSVLFAFSSLALLVAATRMNLSNLTVTLAGLTLLAVVFRVRAVVRELERLNAARHTEARRDALTGLANRRCVLEHLDALLASPRPVPIALLLLDLDRFKEVNDTHGHQAGDDLLEQVARRLGSVTREGDVLARLGGDEFVVVVSGPGVDEQVAVRLARRIREVLRGSFEVAGTRVGIDVSIGVAVRATGDSDQLFKQSDIAMYHAKRAGGGHAVFGRFVPGPPEALDGRGPQTPAGNRPAQDENADRAPARTGD